jgi:hypothetical protein
VLFKLLADIAVARSTRCSARAERYSKLQARWNESGWFWFDVAQWFELRCVKDLAEIRSEREAKKS